MDAEQIEEIGKKMQKVGCALTSIGRFLPRLYREYRRYVLARQAASEISRRYRLD